MFYIANGVLSAISDNVFVATVYIGEVEKAFETRESSRGTNSISWRWPSIPVPTYRASPPPTDKPLSCFLLTSSLAPLIRLSYGRMVIMALPYTFTMGITGWICVTWLL